MVCQGVPLKKMRPFRVRCEQEPTTEVVKVDENEEVVIQEVTANKFIRICESFRQGSVLLFETEEFLSHTSVKLYPLRFCPDIVPTKRLVLSLLAIELGSMMCVKEADNVARTLVQRAFYVSSASNKA